MIVEYKAKLKSIEPGGARVNIHRTLEGVVMPLLGPVFLAILRDMKDTNTRAFYEAMTMFANEDLDDAMDWMEEQIKDD